jgi:hypothetical protein
MNVENQPPPQMLWGLITIHAIARCIHVIAEAGVADALDNRPVTAGELAAKTGLNPDALSRMLRLVAGHGVFATGPNGYTHTDASRLLRSDHPQSLRSFARMIGMPAIWQGFTDLDHAAHAGKPAKGMADMVDYFATHPHEASLFNQAMVGKSAACVPLIADAYDFSGFRTIADVGGGRGHLLQAILRQTTASGVLFDLPHVIADAKDVASERLKLQAGDFFRDALPVADAYLLMEVIHDWADEQAERILAAIRQVAPPGACVLIVEALVSESPGPHFGKQLDIVMLAVTGGRERTQLEYERLLGATGFRLRRVIPTPSQYALVEATVV